MLRPLAVVEPLEYLIDTNNNSSDDYYESSNGVNVYGLASDEIREEEIKEDDQDRRKRFKATTDAFCDGCFNHKVIAIRKNVAFYLCYLCNKYLCDKCFELKCIQENESHKFINSECKESDRDGQIGIFLDEMRDETKREKMLLRENVSIADRVNVKHKNDMKECAITGLCGLDDTGWVVCDFYNYCIKIFSVGSNILQRYIRCGFKPWDVTEINVKREPTDQDVMSTSVSSDIYLTNQVVPKKQCLLAVTLRSLCSIVITDIAQNPAVKIRSIETKYRLCSIEFCENKIFTTCCDYVHPDRGWFVSVMSTDGVTLQTIYTGIQSWIVPYIAVCPGRIYATDWKNNKVLCMTDEGKGVYHKTINNSRPYGISVDPETNTVYVSACSNHKIYRLDSSLESCESLIDFKSVNLTEPGAMCFYRDKLYVGHDGGSTYENFINVVRIV